MTKRKISIEL